MPDFSSIGELFAELQAFIEKNWRVYELNSDQNFENFLESCVDVVGGKEQSAKAHFRHAGVTVQSLAKLASPLLQAQSFYCCADINTRIVAAASSWSITC